MSIFQQNEARCEVLVQTCLRFADRSVMYCFSRRCWACCLVRFRMGRTIFLLIMISWTKSRSLSKCNLPIFFICSLEHVQTFGARSIWTRRTHPHVAPARRMQALLIEDARRAPEPRPWRRAVPAFLGPRAARWTAMLSFRTYWSRL